MIYNYGRRLVVMKPGTNAKYILNVLTATVEKSYPFSIPAASIEVLASDGVYDYIANVEFDDIVRLQTYYTTSETQKIVWKDRFEGRIINSKSQWGTGPTATFICAGHADVARYTNLEVPITQETPVDSKTIATSWNYFLQRIQVTVPDAATFNMAYSLKKDQKFLKDALLNIEEASGFTYFFDAKAYYDNNLNLDHVNLEYKPVPSVATAKYAVRQGSDSLISANFTVLGQDMCNQVIYYGQTPSGGSQYEGDAIDETSADKYDLRTYKGTDTSFSSSDICAQFATNLLPYEKELKVTGSAIMMGTGIPRLCDLVPVKITNISVKGGSLDTNMRVVRITDNMSTDNDTTTLEFNKLQKQPSDYIFEFARKNRLTLSQFIS